MVCVHIIVEARVLISVLFEYSFGIGDTKVLEMEQR